MYKSSKALNTFPGIKSNEYTDVYGVEVEVEGFTGGDQLFLDWLSTNDGSLINGREFVTHTPEGREETIRKLEQLNTFLKSSEWSFSDRTGVHVHFNVSHKISHTFFKFLTLYYIFEECFVHKFGDNRKGNFFCLRAVDSYEVISRVCRDIKRNKLYETLNENAVKYSALNLSTLRTLGTIEFRAIQTNEDFMNNVILTIDFFNELWEVAENFSSVEDIIYAVSDDGFHRFPSVVLPTFSKLIEECPDYAEKIKTGVRLVQDFTLIEN